MRIESRGTIEFAPLTDSLASQIRWRLCDYDAMLRAQVELLLDGKDGDEFEDRLTLHRSDPAISAKIIRQ